MQAMRDRKRIDPVMVALDNAWKLHPDLRLGQLLYVAAGNPTSIFGVEDDVFLAGLKKIVKEAVDEERARHSA